jgi:3-(3-hydroxy-phenyl)propionate hydroxylase
LVVGAGPIGATAAYHLAEQGLDVAVIDPRAESDEAPFSVLIYPDTLRRLRSMGIEPDDLGETLSLPKVALYEGGERRSILRFGADDERDGPLVVAYDALDAELAERLEEKRVEVSWLRRVSSLKPDHESVALRVDELGRETAGYAIMHLEEVVLGTHDARAGWVVVADGPESDVRNELEVELEPLGEEAIYAVLELSTPGPSSDEMRIILDGHATATQWPLPGGGQRIGLRLLDTGGYREPLREVKPEPTVRDLMHLIRERHPWFEADADDLVRARVEHFQPAVARSLGASRIFFIGEAAHRLEPLSSRALNEGLLEAERIGSSIAGVVEGLTPADLGTYQRDVRQILETVVAPERCFETSERTEPWLAQHFERIAPLLPADGRDLDRLLADLGLPRRKAA